MTTGNYLVVSRDNKSFWYKLDSKDLSPTHEYISFYAYPLNNVGQMITNSSIKVTVQGSFIMEEYESLMDLKKANE